VTQTERPPAVDLATFSLSDVVRSGVRLRTRAAEAVDLPAAAAAVVEFFQESFSDAASGRPAFASARLSRWTTHGEPEELAAHGDGPQRADDLVAQLRTARDLGVGARSCRVVHRADPEGTTVAFGGTLSGREGFAVVLESCVDVPPPVIELFGALAVNTRLGLLVHRPESAGVRADALAELLLVLEETSEVQAARLEEAVAELAHSTARLTRSEDDLKDRERRLRDEAALVEALHSVGTDLAAELDLDTVVQRATDAATALTGAAFGSFFYNVIDELGESYLLYAISGVPREAFSGFPMPRNTAVFDPTFRGHGVVRSDDITADPRFGRNDPHFGLPEGHLPVVSYLAVPVISPSGEVLGGFFFGHPQPGRFGDRQERLAIGVAAQSAVALDNARLYQRQRNAAVELQRSLLPRIPEVEGLSVISRYRPAARGAEVGGDWVDLIPLSAGRVALVAGDVMGKGIHAAAVMGQLRAAVRAYATLDLPPAQTVRLLNSAMAHLPSFEMATCVYAVFDPVNGTLCMASAGHMPPALIAPDGTVRLLEDRLGPPLGAGDLAYREVEHHLPPGTGLLLYTDGLVERRGRDLGAGLDALTAELTARPLLTPDTVDTLIDTLVELDRHDDDLALLYIRQPTDLNTGAATYTLTAQPQSTRDVRLFAIDTLVGWGVRDSRLDSVVLVIHELVSNAIRHARTDGVELHLRRLPGRLVIEVVDEDARLPFLIDPRWDDEQHRGLHLVRAYAERWGARPTASGKVVWAEVPL
jgi:serine phosphatase RsbU (regulator of sigma subunit)/anti-sigma regulatory factor (Ser/Thr protein kinase)